MLAETEQDNNYPWAYSGLMELAEHLQTLKASGMEEMPEDEVENIAATLYSLYEDKYERGFKSGLNSATFSNSNFKPRVVRLRSNNT